MIDDCNLISEVKKGVNSANGVNSFRMGVNEPLARGDSFFNDKFMT